MTYQVDTTMRLRLVRVVQIVSITSFLLCAVLAIYSMTARLKEGNSDFKVVWQERAPRSLDISKEYENLDERTELKRVEPTKRTTAKPPFSQEDLFISVKTTLSYHRTRLDLILKTWYKLARDQTWFFTDAEDPEYKEKTNGHLINTNCTPHHNRRSLCCKMSVEFDTFLESTKKGFCHFDDDNYVNVPQLVRVLQQRSWKDDWYLGKPSIRAPLEILNKDNLSQKLSFWFATGGAGFCISRALALKMSIVAGGRIKTVGENIRFPDDVTMGYIIEHLLKVKLTVIEEFHSHLEPMKFLEPEKLPEQISFSFSKYDTEMNALTVEGFDRGLDPTRFLSLHCRLFPNFTFCPKKLRIPDDGTSVKIKP